MKYETRRWVKPEDLNPSGTLFGGRMLAWIDEEIGIYSSLQLDTPRTAVRHLGAINFVSPVKLGAIVEIGMEVQQFGSTSITLSCCVRDSRTHKTILTIARIVMVALDAQGRPKIYGKRN